MSDKRQPMATSTGAAWASPVLVDSVTDSQKPAAIEHNIEQTRAHMSETLAAIEQRLNPTELREKAVEELHVVEVRVKEAVREQIEETKAKVTEELIEAKEKLTGELIEAKDRAKNEVKQAFVQVKHEVKEAFHEAGQAVRDATIGKVEHMARRANETVVETRETIVETIRANPIPAALTGLGLVWLFMNRTRRSDIQMRHSQDQRRMGSRDDVSGHWQDDGGAPRGGYGRGYDERGLQGRGYPADGYPAQYGSSGEGYYNPQVSRGQQGGIGETLHHAQDAVEHAAHQVQDRVSGLAHQASDKVSGLANQAQEMAHQASDKVSGLAHQAADAAGGVVDKVTGTASSLAHQASDKASQLAHQASSTANDLAHRASAKAGELSHQASDTYHHLSDEARQQARRVEQTFESTLHTNPLALGAVALAVGAVVGLSLPSTRREDELMGETRNQLLHRAQEVAHDAIETAHHYSEQAAEQVKGSLGVGQHGQLSGPQALGGPPGATAGGDCGSSSPWA